MKNTLLLVLALFSGEQLFGQPKPRRLPNNINLPSVNTYAPFISLDGNSLVFTSDYAEDKALSAYYTVKSDAVNWKDPVMLAKNVNNRLNFVKGYALSGDGKILFVSSVKDGWGGFDIFSSELRNGIWAEPVNAGTSINTNLNEACPSLSADGSTIFFMRCNKMMTTKAEGCKIFMARKKATGEWDKAVELPASVNTGNSQAPRIMGDGEMLIFASDQLTPNKGGMDLYVTWLNDGQWSAPRPLDFANTPADDQFASAASTGRFLMKDLVTGSKSELVEVQFPTDLKPKVLLKVEGKIAGPPNLASPFVSVYNMKDQTKISGTRPTREGTFTLFLKEGLSYEVSVEPEQDNYTFYARTFDLTGEKFSIAEKMDVVIKPVAAGTELELPGLAFRQHNIDLLPSSQQELRRLMRLIKGNPAFHFNIDVTLNGYLKDSIKRNEDLTEVMYDTLHIPVTYEVTVELDSALGSGPDSLALTPDSLRVKRDSVILETRDSVVIRSTYHNDRTEQQAMAVVYYLVSQGINADRLTHSHHANEEAVLEKRKTMVRVTARP